jgi:very-short-patch-repair endonuclease
VRETCAKTRPRLEATSKPPGRRIQIRSAGADRSYFADFVCREEKLVVEVDGAAHSTDDERRRDVKRGAFLMDQGYRVPRFHNEEVYRNIAGVLETILAALERRSTL